MLIPSEVRAVYFDAVGTLIHPDPPAPVVYAEAGRRHGSRLSVPEVARRFRDAFRRQEELDRQTGWRTSEAREEARWCAIVGEVLDDAADPEACFRELFAHFSRPEGWRLGSAAGAVVTQLYQRGYRLGIASNYDERLRTVVAGLPSLAACQHLVISAEVGWRKPAAEFYAALCQRAGLTPGQVLLVGDDRCNDYDGARAAGLRAVLLDPVAGAHERADTICSLGDLLG